MVRCRGVIAFDYTQWHTTVGRTPLDEASARRRDLYLTTHNTHNWQASMPPAGFEPAITAADRPQTLVLDRSATGIGLGSFFTKWIWKVVCIVVCMIRGLPVQFWTLAQHGSELSASASVISSRREVPATPVVVVVMNGKIPYVLHWCTWCALFTHTYCHNHQPLISFCFICV